MDVAVENLRRSIAACRDTTGMNEAEIRARHAEVRKIALNIGDEFRAAQIALTSELARVKALQSNPPPAVVYPMRRA